MVYHQQLTDTLVTDAVLTGQNQRMGEELLTARADQLPLDVLDWNLMMEDIATENRPIQAQYYTFFEETTALISEQAHKV